MSNHSNEFSAIFWRDTVDYTEYSDTALKPHIVYDIQGTPAGMEIVTSDDDDDDDDDNDDDESFFDTVMMLCQDSFSDSSSDGEDGEETLFVLGGSTQGRLQTSSKKKFAVR